MEKYSVSQDPERTKTSEAGPPRCPICGRQAERKGNVLSCPEHGTAPWEGR